jgi:hypothetical protein
MLGTWYRPEHRDVPFAMQRDRVYGFEFDFHGRSRLWNIYARFTDDAGLNWQIDSELHLENWVLSLTGRTHRCIRQYSKSVPPAGPMYTAKRPELC